MPAPTPPPPPGTLALILTFGFLWGANTGSFLNVVAHRLPMGMSVVRPRSRCPACRTRIRAVENVPILSWLALGARCRGCKGRISARYPAVEALSGLLGMHVAHTLILAPGAWDQPRAWFTALAVFGVAAALLAASLIDADHRILPDEITIPGMWAGPVVAAFLPGVVFGTGGGAPSWVPQQLPLPLQAAVFSAAGVAVGAGVIWGLGRLGTVLFRKEAMGFGDVKFLGMIGGFTGPGGVILALVLASIAGTVWGPLQKLVTRDERIPFGPFLALGGYVVLLHGDTLVAWYLRLTGL